MKAIYTVVLILGMGIAQVQSQQARDYAVMLQAKVAEAPATIQLNWPLDTVGTGYKVYRKNETSNQWNTLLATLAANATSFTDSSIQAGKLYEYYVQRTYANAQRLAHGYICSGINVNTIQHKGIIKVMVDANYVLPLASELAELRQDLINDHWFPKFYTIQRNANITQVKSFIEQPVAEAPDQLPITAVYLLGRIPVPYSGGFKAVQGFAFPPDGHADHGGAWPADVYYTSFTPNFWTDVLVNDTTPTRASNKNIIGDGKFDQMFLENNQTSMQIGRVDLSNMPAFGKSDTALMQQYLQRAHAYKNAILPVEYKAIIDDNFGAMNGEAFAASGWRSFSTLVGDSVKAGDYLTSVKSNYMMFSYGCGAGSYTNCTGVANTTQFNNDSIQQIFTMLFGSYFGDWDSQNNLLRAPLASKNGGLASMWSGRPHWHLHPMAMGKTIGFCQQLVQQNYSNFTGSSPFGYAMNAYGTSTTIALMGDPTLRVHMREPLSFMNAISSVDSSFNIIVWNKVNNAIGYYIQKGRGGVQLAANDTFWIDKTPYNGYTTYTVYPIYKQQTPSGTYYNTGLGKHDSAYSKLNVSLKEVLAIQVPFAVFPNPATDQVFIQSTNEDGFTYSVYDLMGKCLLNGYANSREAMIQTEQFLSGLYIVTMSNNKQQNYSAKLVIAR